MVIIDLSLYSVDFQSFQVGGYLVNIELEYHD